jgi:hypothetical protein
MKQQLLQHHSNTGAVTLRRVRAALSFGATARSIAAAATKSTSSRNHFDPETMSKVIRRRFYAPKLLLTGAINCKPIGSTRPSLKKG